jgi:hypothetical protein
MYTFNGVSIKSPEGSEKKLKKDNRTQMEVYMGMLNSQYNFGQITKQQHDDKIQLIFEQFYNN